MTTFNMKAETTLTRNRSGHVAYRLNARDRLMSYVLTSFVNEPKYYGDNTDELLADVVSAEAFSVVDNKVGTGAAINGGVAYVHSRKLASKVAVSTQDVVVANSILAQYQSDTARNTAILSYGGKTSSDFLTPNLDEIVAAD